MMHPFTVKARAFMHPPSCRSVQGGQGRAAEGARRASPLAGAVSILTGSPRRAILPGSGARRSWRGLWSRRFRGLGCPLARMSCTCARTCENFLLCYAFSDYGPKCASASTAGRVTECKTGADGLRPDPVLSGPAGSGSAALWFPVLSRPWAARPSMGKQGPEGFGAICAE